MSLRLSILDQSAAASGRGQDATIRSWDKAIFISKNAFHPPSSSCSTRHITFPLPLLGKASANCTTRGTL